MSGTCTVAKADKTESPSTNNAGFRVAANNAGFCCCGKEQYQEVAKPEQRHNTTKLVITPNMKSAQVNLFKPSNTLPVKCSKL